MSIKKIIKNQQGQTLVIIIVLMILALSIGIAISSRYIIGLRNVTQADQSTKAIGLAEAAIERLLVLPITTLEEYAVNGTCTTDCHLEIVDDNGQILTADVELSVLGNTSEPFFADLVLDESTQINLNGYLAGSDLYICWNDPDMSITGYYIYGSVGNYQAQAYSYNPTTTTNGSNNFDLATPLQGYNNCFTVVAEADSVMLRLRALYEESFAVVIPSSGATLPTQGILIESTGRAGTTQKKVSVIVTDPVLPSQFDYSLLQKDPTQPLSN